MITSTEDREPRYRVQVLDSRDEAKWNQFVEENDGTFFHHAGWRRIIENSLGHPTLYLWCERDGEMVGVLPLAQVKSWLFGNILASLPFLVYGGVLAADDRAQNALIRFAQEYAENKAVDYVELRYQHPSGSGNPVRSTHATFRKRLHADPESNLLAIPRKQRAMIRKAMKFGLISAVDDDVDRLYSALLECKRNLGTPFFSLKFLRDVKEEFGDDAEVLTVTKSDKLVCSVMSFKFQHEILPYYGGGGRIARELNGNDFMYWSAMKRACVDGVTTFDFGRSAIGSGAYRFKVHWGFEPSPLHYEIIPIGKTSPRDTSPTNPKYRLFVNAWKRMPLPIAGALGPPLARRLG